jgi:hypothetical protein
MLTGSGVAVVSKVAEKAASGDPPKLDTGTQRSPPRTCPLVSDQKSDPTISPPA